MYIVPDDCIYWVSNVEARASSIRCFLDRQDLPSWSKMTLCISSSEILTPGQGAFVKEKYMFEFETAWGKSHNILSPIIQYENESVSPRWTHGPVPYFSNENVAWA